MGKAYFITSTQTVGTEKLNLAEKAINLISESKIIFEASGNSIRAKDCDAKLFLMKNF